ncbi:ribonuclease domain-containing protein [Streptomyces sp. NPDC096033]|uniref:ribonuclease domain-containing protein n=1 Tax=Streptomyces sp. NPDC096033 TaxID=3366071 RepID=UPI00381A5672
MTEREPMPQSITWRTVAVAASAVVAVSGTSTTALALTPAAGHARPQAQPATSLRAAVPDRAWETLKLIDAGEWPPDDGSGTLGGATWPNRDAALPSTDSAGAPIDYRQWDVNRKQPGKARDAERIVTGSNGTAWYSADNGRTFEQMR